LEMVEFGPIVPGDLGGKFRELRDIGEEIGILLFEDSESSGGCPHRIRVTKRTV